MDPLLKIDHVSVHYPLRGGVFSGTRGYIRAVDDVSLSIKDGEVLGLVGESGCGKSTLCRTVMHLQEPTAGRILLQGRDLGQLPPHEAREARMDMQMVFQDPYASLDPRMTVFDTIAEAVLRREPLGRDALRMRVGELLERVGLHPDHLRRYPHEFSGGQRQRIGIARALAPRPKLLVADEPVSSLDVSVQSQILNLLARLKREEGLAMLFISHDLSVVRHMANWVAVMYLGRIVEVGPAVDVVGHPVHLYTKALLSAVPTPNPEVERSRERILLRGDPPSPTHPPPGCPFAWRSPIVVPPEVAATPGEFMRVGGNRWVELHPATVEDYEGLHSIAETWVDFDDRTPGEDTQ